MRIDEIIDRLLPDIQARVVRPNEEVLAAILGHGWTKRATPQLKRRPQVETPIQYEMQL